MRRYGSTYGADEDPMDDDLSKEVVQGERENDSATG